jgi:hypothetical protein
MDFLKIWKYTQYYSKVRVHRTVSGKNLENYNLQMARSCTCICFSLVKLLQKLLKNDSNVSAVLYVHHICFIKISEPVDFHTFLFANTDLNGQGWALFSIYASSPIDDWIPPTVQWDTILIQQHFNWNHFKLNKI